MSTYRDLRAAGTTTRAAARLTGLSRATAGRKPGVPLRATRVVPANRLSGAERKRVVATLDSPRFVDQPPLQVYAQLLDQDTYLCSVSSMYRILGEHSQVRERRRLARHPARVRPELVTTAPGQVYSWDITKLAGPVKGTFFDAYVMIDIYSRYIVGAVVHAHRRPGSTGASSHPVGSARDPAGAEGIGRVEEVKAAYTSQTCNACKHIAAQSRKNQATFVRVACGHSANADVNAARNIAAGHVVTARGDRRVLARSVKREPQHARPPQVA